MCVLLCLCAFAGWKQRARQDHAPLDHKEGVYEAKTQRKVRSFAFSLLFCVCLEIKQAEGQKQKKRARQDHAPFDKQNHPAFEVN